MRFEAVILAVGAAGTAVLAATGAWGYGGVGGMGGVGIEAHLMLAVGSALALLFPHLWVLFFLLATGRGLRRPAANTANTAAGLAAVAKPRRLAFAALGLAVAALAALLVSGAADYTHPGGLGLHAGLFWAALALQVAALAAEWRALAANGALLAALDR